MNLSQFHELWGLAKERKYNKEKWINFQLEMEQYMSLNRKQWNDMWMSAKQIEKLNDDIRAQDKKELRYQGRCTIIGEELNRIKKLIQSVIGEMK